MDCSWSDRRHVLFALPAPKPSGRRFEQAADLSKLPEPAAGAAGVKVGRGARPIPVLHRHLPRASPPALWAARGNARGALLWITGIDLCRYMAHKHQGRKAWLP